MERIRYYCSIISEAISYDSQEVLDGAKLKLIDNALNRLEYLTSSRFMDKNEIEERSKTIREIAEKKKEGA